MGSVIQGIGSIAGPLISAFTQPSASGVSPAGALGAGFITSGQNKPQGQQFPGSFTPQPGQGAAYNYIPTGQPSFDAGFQNQAAYNAGSGLTAQELANPMLATLLQNRLNPQGAAGVMPWANQAAGMAGQAGATAFGQGAGLGQQGAALNSQVLAALPQFQKILQMGTDPQGALYQRTLQQVSDQLNAQSSQAGLAGSGAGLGATQQGLSNFNIDWQNQQLARALSALQGYSGAVGQAGSTLGAGGALEGQGAALQGQGVQDTLAAGQIPFQAAQGVYGSQQQGLADFLNAIGAGQGIGSNNLANMLSYLSTGQNANAIANNVAMGTQSNAANQNAAASGFLSPLISSGISGLGQGISQLAALFGGGSPDLSGSGIPAGGSTPVGGFGQDPFGMLTGNFTSPGFTTDLTGSFGG